MKKHFAYIAAIVFLSMFSACTPLPDLDALTADVGVADNPVDPSNAGYLAAPIITSPYTTTTNSVSFSWTAVAGASGYYVYKKSGTDATLTITKNDTDGRRDPGTNLTWTESALDPSKYWAFIVTAKVDQQTDGLPSETILIYPAPTLGYVIATAGPPAVPGYFRWYWPGAADMTNAAEQKYSYEVSLDAASWTASPITISAGSEQRGPANPAYSRYYRVAHKGSASGYVNGFYCTAYFLTM